MSNRVTWGLVVALAGIATGVIVTLLYLSWTDDAEPSREAFNEVPAAEAAATNVTQDSATATEPAPLEPVTTVVTATPTSTEASEPAPADEERVVEEGSDDRLTPEQVMGGLDAVCGDFIGIEHWTPEFELLCNVAAISVSWDGEYGWGSVPDLWGWMVECETLLPDVAGALDCNTYETVNSIIIDHQLSRLSGDLSEGPTLAALAEQALREQCERALSGEWADDDLRDDCADYLSGG